MKKHERYSRNILLEEVGMEGQTRLFSSKVLVAGAGGLGSTVLVSLASMGVGNIGIIDFDVVEMSNLNRQFIHSEKFIGEPKTTSAKEFLALYNPDISIKEFNLKLDENNYKDIFGEYEIIIDCFDSFKSKFLLNKIAVDEDKTLIHAGVTEFYGQVCVIKPKNSACLECFLNSSEFPQETKGVLSPVVSTIASIQAMEAAKVILGMGEILTDKLLCYNALEQTFKKLSINQNPSCPICGEKV